MARAHRMSDEEAQRQVVLERLACAVQREPERDEVRERVRELGDVVRELVVLLPTPVVGSAPTPTLPSRKHAPRTSPASR